MRLAPDERKPASSDRTALLLLASACESHLSIASQHRHSLYDHDGELEDLAKALIDQ